MAKSIVEGSSSAKPGNKLRIAVLVAILVAVVAVMVRAGQTYEAKIRGMLDSNPMLQAFLAPSIIGVILYWLNQLWSSVLERVRAACYSSVTIESVDENYLTVLDFISKKCVATESATVLATTKKSNKGTWLQRWRDEDNGLRKKIPEFEFRPGDSAEWHIFEYDGYRLMMLRKKGETIMTGHDRRPQTLEKLQIMVW